MKTREDIDKEYEEAIRPYKDNYVRGIQAAQAVLDANLTKIHDKYKDRLGKIKRELTQAMLEEDSDRVYDLEERLRKIEEDRRRDQMEADHLYRKATAPIRAEYDRATTEARNKRLSAISKLESQRLGT